MAIRLIVLAAGKGTRMKSALPKVLHRLAGKPMLAHVLDTTAGLNPAGVTVVVGHGAQTVQDTIPHHVNWAMQSEQLGTGHAVQQGLEGINDDDQVLITYGDVPLTRLSTFQKLVDACHSKQLGLLTLYCDDPSGYGRIKRVDGKVQSIVEQKDATSEELKINEINAGVLCVNGECLKRYLAAIDNKNAQGEYYLTDIIAMASAEGHGIEAVQPADSWEADGINSREQLAVMERIHQHNLAQTLMANGVTLADPARIDIRGDLATGTDNMIDVNCVFIGDCRIGSNVVIEPNCMFINATVESGTTIYANSVLEDCVVGEACNIGPFARLRPGTRLAKSAKIGNFVETKNAVIGEGSKVNHLSYVGDATVGTNVNVGAGTITCNYDGANKWQTVLEDDVSIGSNSALVAPVTIGKGATVGAGSTITSDVSDKALALTRANPKTIDGWKRPKKQGS